MKSYHILIAGIMLQLAAAIFSAALLGFWGYPAVLVSALFCVLHLRRIPEGVQMERVIEAGKYAERCQYSDESCENFWKENAKLEEIRK